PFLPRLRGRSGRRPRRGRRPRGNASMSELKTAIDELVIANRIVAAEKVCDAFGHVSLRHPHDPKQFLLSRGRAPELIEASDIMTFTLDGATADGTGKPYLERF